MLTLKELQTVIDQRKSGDVDASYVAQLNAKGLNKILEKVGEEATETIIAAKDFAEKRDDQARQALIGEVADLWFHTLVVLSHLDCSEHDIMQELSRRFGTSGIDEKASRSDS